MSALILYTTEDGKSRIQLRAAQQTLWLSQAEMAELFETSKQSISLHLKNLFEDKELASDSVVKESLTTAEHSSVVEKAGRRQMRLTHVRQWHRAYL